MFTLKLNLKTKSPGANNDKEQKLDKRNHHRQRQPSALNKYIFADVSVRQLGKLFIFII